MLLPGFSLLILAGGESSRMGSPKHCLRFQGRTLLEHILGRLDGLFDEILLTVRAPGVFPDKVTPVMDMMSLRCPLVGILSGLLAAANPHVFVIGCDMPFIESELVKMICRQALKGADVTVPVVRGFREPLCAVYNRNCADRIEDMINAGNPRVTGFYSMMRVTEIPEESVRARDPLLNSFVNINTPGEFRRHCRTLPKNRG